MYWFRPRHRMRSHCESRCRWGRPSRLWDLSLWQCACRLTSHVRTALREELDSIPVPQPPSSSAMARDPSILTSHQPTAIAPASVHIAHVYVSSSLLWNNDLTPLLSSQLRDLIICPRERGIVNYVQQKAIVEQNINAPGAVSFPILLVDNNF